MHACSYMPHHRSATYARTSTDAARHSHSYVIRLSNVQLHYTRPRRPGSCSWGSRLAETGRPGFCSSPREDAIVLGCYHLGWPSLSSSALFFFFAFNGLMLSRVKASLPRSDTIVLHRTGNWPSVSNLCLSAVNNLHCPHSRIHCPRRKAFI